MPSNKELTERATVLAAELGVPVVTDGLKNEGLLALVLELEAKRAAVVVEGAESKLPEAPAPAISTPAAHSPKVPPAVPPVNGALPRVVIEGAEPTPPTPPAPLEQRFPYQVAAGKALTTLRGVLDQGTEIKPTDVDGGVPHLEDLVSKGYVTKSAPAKP
jgi:hypothetical protein